MRPQVRIFLFVATLIATVSVTAITIQAQPPGKKDDKGGKGGKGGNESVDDFVAKLMAFNNAKDGKLTKAELTDTRLHALFDRADTKKNGFVTRADLEALFSRENVQGGYGKGGPGGK